jgi:hypothetical protein
VFPTLKCLSGMVLETLNRDHRETTAAAPAARGALASSGGGQSSVASGRFGVGLPPASGSGPSNAAIRTGSSIQQMLATAPPAARPAPNPAPSSNVKPGATATPAGPATAKPAAKKSWSRKVDATPLEQTMIRARPKGAANRRVQIAETRRIPWVAIGLMALIALAAGVVLVTSGLVKLPS